MYPGRHICVSTAAVVVAEMLISGLSADFRDCEIELRRRLHLGCAASLAACDLEVNEVLSTSRDCPPRRSFAPTERLAGVLAWLANMGVGGTNGVTMLLPRTHVPQCA